MRCGGNEDGCSDFMALRYKNTFSNTLISFFYSQKKLLIISGNEVQLKCFLLLTILPRELSSFWNSSLDFAQLNPQGEVIFQNQLGSSWEEGEDIITWHCSMSVRLCGKVSPFRLSWTFEMWSEFR